MSWDKYFNTVSKKELFETIESNNNYIKIVKRIERMYGTVDIEYTVVEDWNTKSPYIETKEKDSIWKFFEYAFGKLKMIRDDIFYIKTESETTFIYILMTLEGNNGIMKPRLILNMVRCHSDNILMELHKKSRGCRMKKIAKEVYEKIAFEMCKEKCAVKIQRKCENWLWKPTCRDGKPGINARLGWRECEKVLNR